MLTDRTTAPSGFSFRRREVRQPVLVERRAWQGRSLRLRPRRRRRRRSEHSHVQCTCTCTRTDGAVNLAVICDTAIASTTQCTCYTCITFTWGFVWSNQNHLGISKVHAVYFGLTCSKVQAKMFRLGIASKVQVTLF